MPSVDAKQRLRRWVDGVNVAGNTDVAGLYAEDCTFLPTLSSDVCRTRAQVEDYFRQLSGQGGFQVILDEDSVVVRALSGGCYALTGCYVFRVGADGTTSVYPARFTFIVDVNQECPILHHHSSRIP